MRKRNSKYFILALVTITLMLSGAYALLAATLNITGTATGIADFKIEFTDATVSDDSKANYTISADGTVLNIETNLSYPGDSATINFTISNTGSLSATVSNITINNNDTEDFNVVIQGIDDIEGTTLSVGDNTMGSVVVTWRITSTNPAPEDVNFSVTLDYIQAT